ncbi:MFS transporter [Cellulomonas hominis]
MSALTAHLHRHAPRPGERDVPDGPPGPAGPGVDDTFNRRLVAPMILGSLLNPVNSSMLAVALVPIGLALGASPSATAWLVSALYLTTAVGQPVVGRLVDRHGPRPLYLIGSALVGVGGLLGALAPNLGVLIGARVLIGLGTCAGYPAAMYLIRSESRRTGHDSPSGILAALAIAAQVTAVIGPTVGGLLIGVGGWRAIFTVNVPLSIACLVLGALRLPRTTGLGDAAEAEPRAGIDLAGMALFATMLVSLMLFLMEPQATHWVLPVLTAAAAAALAVRELHAVDPFLDLRVLGGNLPLLATYLRQLLSYTVAYSYLYGFTQWLEAGRGLGASAAGLVVLPTSAAAIVVTSLSGRRPEVRGKLVVGSIAQIGACVLLLLVHGHSALWLLLVVALVAGIPQGLNGLANQNALYHQADPARMGSAAGLLRTFTYLGAMAASAANAAVYSDGADTGGMHDLALVMLVSAVLLLAATLVDRSLRRTGVPRADREPDPRP